MTRSLMRAGGDQGRRHSFESGGQILQAKQAEKFVDPDFLATVGTKYCLDSYVSLNRMFAALTLV